MCVGLWIPLPHLDMHTQQQQQQQHTAKWYKQLHPANASLPAQYVLQCMWTVYKVCVVRTAFVPSVAWCALTVRVLLVPLHGSCCVITGISLCFVGIRGEQWAGRPCYACMPLTAMHTCLYNQAGDGGQVAGWESSWSVLGVVLL